MPDGIFAKRFYGRYKRPFDLAVLMAAHLILAPVWIVLWLLIPLAIYLEDRGPVLYRQARVGLQGRPFKVIKFRTMVPDAERNTGPVWASKDDPRVTRVGKILRKTALDELPQVINMFRGDMSLVGPRSERPELHSAFVKTVPGFDKRLMVRPGLTGMAQIRGGYDMSPADKLKYDLEYVERMNLLMDVRILVKSVVNTLIGRWDRRDVTKKSPRARDPSGPDQASRK